MVVMVVVVNEAKDIRAIAGDEDGDGCLGRHGLVQGVCPTAESRWPISESEWHLDARFKRLEVDVAVGREE